MADQGKKKKSKSKTKTVSLNEFLSGDGNTPPMPMRTKSWADETNDLEDDELSTAWTDTQKSKVSIDLKSLPSAPRAATAPNIDISKLPKTPPFTAFIGNLSYDASEEDIKKHFEKNQLTVLSVRLVKDKDGRLKGFGYAEFESLVELVNALSQKGTMLRGRQLQVDVAEGRSEGGMGDDRYGNRPSRYDDDDRTTGNWRSLRDSSPPPPPRSYGGYNDRDSSYGQPRGNRDRRDDQYQSRGRDDQYQSRGRDRYDGPRRYSPDNWHSSQPSRYQSSRNGRSPSPRRQDTSDRRSSSSPYRGSPNRHVTPPNRTSPPPNQDESIPSDDTDKNRPNQDSDRQREPQYNGGDRRPYEERRYNERRYDDRRNDDRPPRRDGGYGRGGGGFDRGGYQGDRGGYQGDRGGYQGDRSGYQGDRGGYQGDRGGYRSDRGGYRGDQREYGDQGGRRNFDDGGDRQQDRRYNRSPPRRQSPEELPKERKRLQLQPRSKPVDPVSKENSSSIFGGAKPVDTAKKEREIEEKLKKKEIMVNREYKTGRKDSESSDSWSPKEVKETKRLPSDSDDLKKKDDRERRGSNKEEDHPRKWEDGDFKKGRGRRDYQRPRDDEKQPWGKGRGRGKKNVASDAVKQPIILKKQEEQKPVEFQQKNRFAGLMNDEDSDDKCP